CLGGAAAAWQAAQSVAVWLVTTLPDAPPSAGAFDQQIGDLARGDRIIAPSSYAATPVIERLGVPRERITVVPRSVDTNVFDAPALHKNPGPPRRTGWGPPRRISASS